MLGHLKPINFPFGTNGKTGFRCPKYLNKLGYVMIMSVRSFIFSALKCSIVMFIRKAQMMEI